MKFYFIWTKPFSFELKNTKNIEIINPKKAIKMLFIQKSYSVLLGPFCLLWSTLVLFVLCWSYWVQSIQIGHILSSSVLFGSHWSYSVHYVYFGPLCSFWSYSIHFGPIQPLELKIKKKKKFIGTIIINFHSFFFFLFFLLIVGAFSDKIGLPPAVTGWAASCDGGP